MLKVVLLYTDIFLGSMGNRTRFERMAFCSKLLVGHFSHVGFPTLCSGKCGCAISNNKYSRVAALLLREREGYGGQKIESNMSPTLNIAKVVVF